jgi:hypothetical protein
MYYASNTDRQHALRKAAQHRIIARCLRGHKGELLLALAHEALDALKDTYHGARFIRDWETVLEKDRMEIAELIVRRDDETETLRESSPFMRVFDFDFGDTMVIDFKNPEIRSRMWNLAKRVAMIEPKANEVVESYRAPVAFRA